MVLVDGCTAAVGSLVSGGAQTIYVLKGCYHWGRPHIRNLNLVFMDNHSHLLSEDALRCLLSITALGVL